MGRHLLQSFLRLQIMIDFPCTLFVSVRRLRSLPSHSHHITRKDFSQPPPTRALGGFPSCSATSSSDCRADMRVTLHTGIEPPGTVGSQDCLLILTSLESRPCPPLPIDGPILLPVSSSSTALSRSTAYPEVPTHPAFSTAIAETVNNSEIDTSTMDTSDDSADPKSTVRFKFMPWDASYWLAVVSFSPLENQRPPTLSPRFSEFS